MTTLAPDNVMDLLAELDALGIEMEADGQRLRFRPREKVTPDLADLMKAHKAQLLDTADVPKPIGPPRCGTERTGPVAGPAAVEAPDVGDQRELERAGAAMNRNCLTNNHASNRLKGMSQILEQIRRAIAASDKTRYRLWKETGIDQAQLSRLMSGQDALSFDNLERLAKALGLEIIVRPAKRKIGKRMER